SQNFTRREFAEASFGARFPAKDALVRHAPLLSRLVLCRDGHTHGILRARNRRHAEHRYVAPAALVRLVRPGVGEPGLGMPLEGEHLHDALPHRLALERLADRLGAEVRAVDAVQVADRASQTIKFLALRHWPLPRQPVGDLNRDLNGTSTEV